MTDQSTEAKPPAGITVKRSPDYRTIVADIYSTRVSPGDCTIVCGRFVRVPEEGVSVGIIEEQADILLSWGHLKILAMNLMELVVAIEQEAGPIPIPKAFADISPMRFESHLEAVRQLQLVSIPAPYRGQNEPTSEPQPQLAERGTRDQNEGSTK